MRASQAARGALTRSYVVEKKSSVCSTFEGRGKEKRRKGEGGSDERRCWRQSREGVRGRRTRRARAQKGAPLGDFVFVTERDDKKRSGYLCLCSLFREGGKGSSEITIGPQSFRRPVSAFSNSGLQEREIKRFDRKLWKTAFGQCSLRTSSPSSSNILPVQQERTGSCSKLNRPKSYIMSSSPACSRGRAHEDDLE